jgi:glutathione-regulated potassium-efflux system ancillary protein KefC
MQQVWFIAALWLFLALVAVLAANWLRVSTALSEIVVGTLAQLAIGALAGAGALNAKTEWIAFLAGTGAIVLTFLAGAELDPAVFRAKWKESVAVGLTGFFFPFFGAALVAHYVVGWAWRPSWLAGVALSTTSVAVVYAVMLELGFNRTIYGKAILAACFINDLGTVIALGLIFSPFTVRTVIFLGAALFVFVVLPFATQWIFERYGGRVSELETKYLLFLLFGLGGLAVWSGSEAVLPAYLIGMVLAGTVGKRSLPDPPSTHPDVWSVDAVLFHPRGQFCFGARADGRSAGFRRAILRQDGLEAARSVANGSRVRLRWP